jgi:hypothetical protein
MIDIHSITEGLESITGIIGPFLSGLNIYFSHFHKKHHMTKGKEENQSPFGIVWEKEKNPSPFGVNLQGAF